MTYNYYSDSACKKKLSTAPKNVGTYYVKAKVVADKKYKAATSKAVKLVIVYKYKMYTIYQDNGKQKIGKYYVWRNSVGIWTSTNKSSSGKLISRNSSLNIVSNGSWVYYIENSSGDYGTTGILYQSKLDGTNKKKVVSKMSMTDIMQYYNGKFYVEIMNDEMNISDMYVYNLKKNSFKKLGNYHHPDISGKYMCMRSEYLWGVYETDNLYLCNMSTDKVKKISSKAVNYYVKGNYVYYTEAASSTDEEYFDFVIKKYSISTGKASKIGKTFKNKEMSVDISDTYLIYYSGKSDSYYKYTFSTRKTTKYTGKI